MVTVKQLDPKFPRLGYEIQEGLVVDMPRGDGKAEITETEDGAVRLTEGNCLVTVKNVDLTDGTHPTVTVKMQRTDYEHGNHLTLDGVTVKNGDASIVCQGGQNKITDSILTGHNFLNMDADTVENAYLKDSSLERSCIKDSTVEYSRLIDTVVDDSKVLSCETYGTRVRQDSTVELSNLGFDAVTNATVGGVSVPADVFDYEERTFDTGYFVGDSTVDGYENVTNGEAYTNQLAKLIVNNNLPYGSEKDRYCPSDDLADAIDEQWDMISEEDKKFLLENAPMLRNVVDEVEVSKADIVQSFMDDEAYREADFRIDPNQFEVVSQKGLQQ